MSVTPNTTFSAPLPRTYWVCDQTLLAGAYAGRPTPVEHRMRLAGLIAAGIRTFVNLMEADELDKAGKPFVPYQEDLQRIAAKEGETVECLRFPIKDVSVPSFQQMNDILEAIDDALARTRPVYVHCFGGTGRTGTVISCWLLRHRMATVDNVFDRLKILRQADVERAAARSPDVDEQCRFVKEWFAANGQGRQD